MPLQSKKSVVAIRQQATPIANPANPSLVDTMKQSVAMGAGMSIGQRIVGGLLGTSQAVVEKQVEKCKQQKEGMDQCMKYSGNETPCYEELRAYVHCLNNQ